MTTPVGSTNNTENKPQTLGEEAIAYRNEQEEKYYAAKEQEHLSSKILYALLSKYKSVQNSGNEYLIAQTKGIYSHYKNSVYTELSNNTDIRLSSWRDSVFSAAKLSQC